MTDRCSPVLVVCVEHGFLGTSAHNPFTFYSARALGVIHQNWDTPQAMQFQSNTTGLEKIPPPPNVVYGGGQSFPIQFNLFQFHNLTPKETKTHSVNDEQEALENIT